MRVLAVDTSTEWGSVAIVEDGVVQAELRLRSRDGHSHHVLPGVAFLYDGLRLRPGDVDAYAVVVGPGSFTGLRIGISTVQGLALACARPCLGITTLDVLATRIRGCGEHLVALMDAYRDEVFAAHYDREARRLSEPSVGTLERVLDATPATAVLVGGGALRYRDLIHARLPQATVVDRGRFLAGCLGTLAHQRLLEGAGGDAASLVPIYLREADVGQNR